MTTKQKQSQRSAVSLVDYYQFDFENLKININQEHYSNMVYLSVSGRDVYIDFLKMPGVITDGIPVVSGVRVYMPLASAQRMAETLARTIKTVTDKDNVEPIYAVKEDETEGKA